MRKSPSELTQKQVLKCISGLLLCFLVAKSCLTLSATPPTVAHHGSSVHAVLQARIQEWVAISFSRGSC